MTERQLMELPEWETSDAFSEEEKLALRLTDAMCAAPVQVSDELFAALREKFSEAEIVELASAIAWENYRARFNRVFLVEAEGYSAGAFCPLPLPPGRAHGT